MRMLDNLGEEIEIDDVVTYIHPSFHELFIGIVTGFTDHRVKLQNTVVRNFDGGSRSIEFNEEVWELEVKPSNMTVLSDMAENWARIIISE